MASTRGLGTDRSFKNSFIHYKKGRNLKLKSVSYKFVFFLEHPNNFDGSRKSMGRPTHLPIKQLQEYPFVLRLCTLIWGVRENCKQARDQEVEVR